METEDVAAPTVESSTNGQATETLSVDDTADAPAAGEEEEEGTPAPRELGPEPTTMEESKTNLNQVQAASSAMAEDPDCQRGSNSAKW